MGRRDEGIGGQLTKRAWNDCHETLNAHKLTMQHKKTTFELREAYGVRGACSRFLGPPIRQKGASKLGTLHTLRDSRDEHLSRNTFRISAFGLLSDLGLRISDFNF